jgi:hypothetical protein
MDMRIGTWAIHTYNIDHALNCVKGGGACHLREKVLAEAAKTSVYSSYSQHPLSILVLSADLFSLLTTGKMCNTWAQMSVEILFSTYKG